MKKILLILVVLLMSILGASCKVSKTEELNNFFNSHMFDISMKVKTNEGEFECLKMIATKKAFLFETTGKIIVLEKQTLIIDNDKNIYYKFQDKLLHTQLEDDWEQDYNINIYDYISDINDYEDYLAFSIDISKFLEDLSEDLKDVFQGKSKVTFICLYDEKGKVSKLKYFFQGGELILYVNAYTNNKRKNAKDIGIEEIQIPKIEDCDSLLYKEFINYVSDGFVCSIIDLELDSITYGFKIDDYVYLCDKQYLYKYDVNCAVQYAKLDLQCQGQAHYVKGEYLYVAAHYPYTTTYNDSDSYDGTVTQIKLSNFAIEKQVHVKCLPESIIVDNRGAVILSRGANQHVKNVQVNMETGELTPVFSGYQGDVLLYDSVNDAIIVLTTRTTNDNLLYKYNDSKWEYVGIASIEVPIVYYRENDSYIAPVGIYEFNTNKNKYVLNGFDLEKIKNYYILYVTVDNEKAYILGSNNYDINNKVNSFIIYDLKTDKTELFSFPEKFITKVKFAYVCSGYLYIVKANGSILKVKL